MKAYEVEKNICIFEERLSSIKEDKKVLSFEFWVRMREQKRELMTDNHGEIKQELYVESGIIAVEICYICSTVL